MVAEKTVSNKSVKTVEDGKKWCEHRLNIFSTKESPSPNDYNEKQAPRPSALHFGSGKRSRQLGPPAVCLRGESRAGNGACAYRPASPARMLKQSRISTRNCSKLHRVFFLGAPLLAATASACTTNCSMFAPWGSAEVV